MESFLKNSSVALDVGAGSLKSFVYNCENPCMRLDDCSTKSDGNAGKEGSFFRVNMCDCLFAAYSMWVGPIFIKKSLNAANGMPVFLKDTIKAL